MKGSIRGVWKGVKQDGFHVGEIGEARGFKGLIFAIVSTSKTKSRAFSLRSEQPQRGSSLWESEQGQRLFRTNFNMTPSPRGAKGLQPLQG